MDRDFDSERAERAPTRVVTFKVGGEQFHVRPFVPADMLTYFDDLEIGEAKKTIGAFDDFILGVIDPSEAKKWRNVRKKADPPLNMADLEDVAFWLLGQISGRPTMPLSASAPGSGSQGAPSSKAA